MKKLRFISFILVCCFLIVGMCSCKGDGEIADSIPSDTLQSDNETEDTSSDDRSENTEQDNSQNVEGFDDMLEKVDRVSVDKLKLSDSYTIAIGEELRSYYEQTLDVFFGVCKQHRDDGYELYNYHVMNGNHFATYYKGTRLRHIYWIEGERELNVVYSTTGGSSLPSKNSMASDSRSEKLSVTQLQSTRINGMGYVVQLSDGSFIIYDGGYAELSTELWNTLVELNGSEENINIRAWLMTHAHNDHYPCFTSFANSYSSKVTLETLMISPINSADAYDNYLNSGVHVDLQKFSGAKLLYVHTGMLFEFGNAKMEILFTPDELYIADAYGLDGKTLIDFNNTSIVSRIYTDNSSCIFLGDAGDFVAYRLIAYYGKYLKSDMCQIAHHGVENFPLIGYRYIDASILWYPCSASLYNRTDRDADVRQALKESASTKEIILHDSARVTRYFE